MNIAAFLIYVLPCVMGIVAGLYSGYHLTRQVIALDVSSSKYFTVLTLVRLAGLGAVAWYLLQWGPIPFILFGGSLVIAKWVAILCLSE
jgi:hypothetical protein